ncbi:MAG: four helix bundle protein [Phascolarctobacterium sp.]|nr:four helix bundle protein [Phascolarctobacterium sp.]
MEENNVIVQKSKSFALRIVKLNRFLCNEKKEYVMSKQVLRSGTSIGANVKEGIYAQSKADFNTKMYVALKEASETEYWLELLYESGYIDEEAFNSIYVDCKEILRILMSITKTLKEKSN